MVECIGTVENGPAIIKYLTLESLNGYHTRFSISNFISHHFSSRKYACMYWILCCCTKLALIPHGVQVLKFWQDHSNHIIFSINIEVTLLLVRTDS